MSIIKIEEYDQYIEKLSTANKLFNENDEINIDPIEHHNDGYLYLSDSNIKKLYIELELKSLDNIEKQFYFCTQKSIQTYELNCSDKLSKLINEIDCERNDMCNDKKINPDKLKCQVWVSPKYKNNKFYIHPRYELCTGCNYWVITNYIYT